MTILHLTKWWSCNLNLEQYSFSLAALPLRICISLHLPPDPQDSLFCFGAPLISPPALIVSDNSFCLQGDRILA